MEMKGFLTINDYNPAEPYWDLMIRGKKPRPMTLEKVKEKYIIHLPLTILIQKLYLNC